MKDGREILGDQFWRLPDPRQTITIKQLQNLFLERDGKIIVKGNLLTLAFRKVCPGIYEIFLAEQPGIKCPYCKGEKQ
jgi:hypothetical protein